MGFSAPGLALGLAVFAPNLLLAWFPPRPAIGDVRVPAAFTLLERAGQALCLTVPVFTVGSSVSWWWLAPVAFCVAAYWALWTRYLVTGRRRPLLFDRVCGVPVPMAVLPVAAFLTSAVWLTNPWIAGAALVLAAGHIPASLITARAL